MRSRILTPASGLDWVELELVIKRYGIVRHMPDDKTIADVKPSSFDEEDQLDATMAMVVEDVVPPIDGTAPYMPVEDPKQSAQTQQKALHEKIQKRVNRSGPRVKKDPLIGKVFGGRFEITGKIGAGGMGIVYKARQRGMDRNVAIKVLLKEYLTNETAVRRFEREALAVSKLEHPNTVRIYDFGESDEGMLYIAMEFLVGAPLERRLKREGNFSVRTVLRVVQQICRSLDEAHKKGIIHRDLKPDNVFVGEIEGQKDFAKVLDFGVAKLRENTEGGTLTQHGTIFGTPKYMSPEQCKSEDLDARSDLYSVGVMMFEMLSGRTPFESENPLAILIMHAQDEVPALAEVRPDLVIPFEVEELMHRLLEKERVARPDDAKAVIDECEMLLQMVPDEFEEVITYEEAERGGMDFNRSQAYTVKNRLTNLTSLTTQDQTRRATVHVDGVPDLPSSPWRKYMLASGALVAVCIALLGYLYTQVKAVPASARPVIPAELAEGALASTELPAIEPRLVKVIVEANLDNVTVVDAASGAILGELPTADTPVEFQWLHEMGRKVELQLKYGALEPKNYTIDLGEKETVLPKAVFELPTLVGAPVIEKVSFTAIANVPRALVKIKGTDGWRETPAEPGRGLEIPVVKGDEQVEITFKKAGYLPVVMMWTPSANGQLTADLKPDPAAQVAIEAAPKEVTLTLSTNVSKVEVEVVATSRIYKIAQAKVPKEITLPMGDEPLELKFSRAGYKILVREFTPSADGSLAIVMERRKSSTTSKDPNTGNTGNNGSTKPAPIEKLNPIKKPKSGGGGVGRIKRIKGM